MERGVPGQEGLLTFESVQGFFTAAYEQFYPNVLGLTTVSYGRGLPPDMDPVDLLHEAFLRIYRRAGKPKMLDVTSPWQARRYWRQSIHNLYIEVGLRDHHLLSLDETDQDGLPLIQIPDHAVNVQDEVVGVERDDTIALLMRNMVAGLALEQREVLELQLAGLEYEQIAAQLGKECSTVRVRAYRGRNVLRERLAAMGITSADF